MERDRLRPSTKRRNGPASNTLGPISSQKRPRHHHNTSHPRHQLVPKLHTTYWTIPRHTCHSPLCRRHHYIRWTDKPTCPQKPTHRTTSNPYFLHPPSTPRHWHHHSTKHNQNNNRKFTNHTISITKSPTYALRTNSKQKPQVEQTTLPTPHQPTNHTHTNRTKIRHRYHTKIPTTI